MRPWALKFSRRKGPLAHHERQVCFRCTAAWQYESLQCRICGGGSYIHIIDGDKAHLQSKKASWDLIRIAREEGVEYEQIWLSLLTIEGARKKKERAERKKSTYSLVDFAWGCLGYFAVDRGEIDESPGYWS